ncbi:ABC transporter ATP-binding protein [Variovorax sp. J22R133]|uniref:ABC transporter ATP-binding protein n=1 Tax=Variovorax brevis TaxID=3053503 RepID=UPI002576381E|nr:ABC transporter ATP-binding protein [Variovorax sp. J22R133]MDM0115222.1 ABC transporter ATP-binding protein [Variovorax sp. J22R133]
MAQISLRGVDKRYGAVHALNDLTLDIRDREFFVLLGPTGAGKSTTLRCIAGLEQPESGDIEIAGERINDWSAAQRDVALVFQQYSLYPNYTVRENLAFPLKSKLRNFSAQQIEERVNKAASTVRITHLLDRRTDRLSGGEMQRVSIGRAIVREPRVFLMDEPLSNLDAKLRELLRAELKGLQQRLGTTLVFVTHDQVEAMTMGDRIGVVHEGRLIQVGTPYEIYNTPKNTFVASFVGTPAINLLDLTIDLSNSEAQGDAIIFKLDDGTRNRLAALALPEGGTVRVGARPEDVRLVSSGGIPGVLYGAENHGVEIIAIIQCGPHMLRATIPADSRVAVNDPVQFAFAQDKLHYFHPDTGESLRA